MPSWVVFIIYQIYLYVNSKIQIYLVSFQGHRFVFYRVYLTYISPALSAHSIRPLCLRVAYTHLPTKQVVFLTFPIFSYFRRYLLPPRTTQKYYFVAFVLGRCNTRSNCVRHWHTLPVAPNPAQRRQLGFPGHRLRHPGRGYTAGSFLPG